MSQSATGSLSPRSQSKSRRLDERTNRMTEQRTKSFFEGGKKLQKDFRRVIFRGGQTLKAGSPYVKLTIAKLLMLAETRL